MAIFINILLAVNLLITVLIILITLMQRPKQEGLGAAFGGGMTDNLFGAQTTNVLAKITRWLGGMFFVICLVVSALYARQSTAKSSIQKQLLEQPQPATPQASATPSAPAEPTTSPAAAPSASPEAPAPQAAESAASPAVAEGAASPAAQTAPAQP